MGINTILVVDDNEGDQLLAQITIEQFDKNIKVLQAFDGNEALDILLTSLDRPDVIFLDINMPGMNGHEFLERYTEYAADSYVVVMLTTSDQSTDREKCEAYPFVKKYLMKPLTVDNLKEIAGLL